ncbi:kinase inhibitor [Andreprevotia chitinilytica]|uniref:kinase inhibitor n=1 Tax=Andreprevotia chitinilytica TaxID=396808 RepID=UPI00068C20EE|nr:kinase inhibitor [Andreprevotia chitinilytica]
MKTRSIFAPTLAALAFAAAGLAQAAGFTLTSPDVANGKKLSDEQVFAGFGCTGKNVSPALEWKNAPAGTKSFAVTVYDPDAPTGSGWWHWLVVNIPASATGLAHGAGSTGGSLPANSLQTRTDFGAPGFGGACPPQGDKPHRYIFTVYALKTDKLDVTADSSAALVGFNLHFNTLGKASLTAKYGH